VARKHVFPVCGLGSELKEFSNPLDFLLVETTNQYKPYLSENEDMVAYANDSGVINSLQVFLNASKGEFLLDFPDVSFDGVSYSTSPFFSVGFANTLSTYATNPNQVQQKVIREKLDDVGLDAAPKEGQIACIALKRIDDVFTTPSKITFKAYNYFGHDNGDDVYGYNYPYGALGLFLAYNGFINENKWATLMFTGTRWVVLGSNNWY